MICTFKATVTSEGRLFGVTLHPENDPSISPVFSTSPSSFLEWKTEPFSIDVEGDFDYACMVGGPRGQRFALTIEIMLGDKWEKLVDEHPGKIGKGCGPGRSSNISGCIISYAELP